MRLASEADTLIRPTAALWSDAQWREEKASPVQSAYLLQRRVLFINRCHLENRDVILKTAMKLDYLILKYILYRSRRKIGWALYIYSDTNHWQYNKLEGSEQGLLEAVKVKASTKLINKEIANKEQRIHRSTPIALILETPDHKVTIWDK